MIAVTVLAIPIYFGLMAVELAYEAIINKKTYRLSDAITNISTGTLQQTTGVFFEIVKIGIYAAIFEHFAFYELPNNAWTFAALFILYDLAYYWEHRLAHTVSLFWGGHVVHHQSEDYNLSVALRQTSTGFIWGFPFFLPMALIGFDPKMLLLIGGLNLLYQFWIHTEHIDRLPRWFEWVFNTPSHHRVHHGRNPKYIDKNFAGVFIIWDRLFGTFKEEEERPTYGVTTPLQSWNPLYANISHYIYLFRTTSKSRSAMDSLRILFKKPGWQPDYMGGYLSPTMPDEDYQKYNTPVLPSRNKYVFAHFLLLLFVVPLFFFLQKDMILWLRFYYAAWIVMTTLSFAFMFEKSAAWLWWFEVSRMLALVVLSYFVADSLGLSAEATVGASSLISILSLAYFKIKIPE
jgi:sterol desaturase/sphingolipid hydroxylase (fatty acid hydroxylase superfamily)